MVLIVLMFIFPDLLMDYMILNVISFVKCKFG